MPGESAVLLAARQLAEEAAGRWRYEAADRRRRAFRAAAARRASAPAGSAAEALLGRDDEHRPLGVVQQRPDDAAQEDLASRRLAP